MAVIAVLLILTAAGHVGLAVVERDPAFLIPAGLQAVVGVLIFAVGTRSQV